MKYTKLIILTVILNFSPSIFSPSIFSAQNDFIQWHSQNIQLLRGFDYQLGAEQRTIVTVEHASRWQYGDFFIFADSMHADKSQSDYYVEPLLRFSLGKLFGSERFNQLKNNSVKNKRVIENSFIKDILIATQVEKPKGQRVRVLAGVAVDLNIKSFQFFKTHLFIRDNPDLTGTTLQATLVWKLPLTLGSTPFLIEGFADITGAEGNTVSHQLIVPRFLVDAGTLLNTSPNKLWVGIEWQYWHNKFGVNGVTESVPQLQIKYIF